MIYNSVCQYFLLDKSLKRKEMLCKYSHYQLKEDEQFQTNNVLKLL